MFPYAYKLKNKFQLEEEGIRNIFCGILDPATVEDWTKFPSVIIMIFYCGLMVHITDTRAQKVFCCTSAHITETVLAHGQHWEDALLQLLRDIINVVCY